MMIAESGRQFWLFSDIIDALLKSTGPVAPLSPSRLIFVSKTGYQVNVSGIALYKIYLWAMRTWRPTPISMTSILRPMSFNCSPALLRTIIDRYNQLTKQDSGSEAPVSSYNAAVNGSPSLCFQRLRWPADSLRQD